VQEVRINACASRRERVELVVGQHRLDVAVGLDRGERLPGGGDAAEGDAQRVVERARGCVQALDDLAQRERFVLDDQDPAEGFGHAGSV